MSMIGLMPSRSVRPRGRKEFYEFRRRRLFFSFPDDFDLPAFWDAGIVQVVAGNSCAATGPGNACGWRIVILPIFPPDPKLNVTVLHCAQNLPQDQFARDTANLASSTFTFARTASSTANITSAPPHNL